MALFYFVLFCFPFHDLMAGIKATEKCLTEQSYGKLLSVQRTVIKTDRFGLSIPMVPALGSVGGRTPKMTPEDSAVPGIQRRAGTSPRWGRQGMFLSILVPPGPPQLKGLILGSKGGCLEYIVSGWRLFPNYTEF